MSIECIRASQIKENEWKRFIQEYAEDDDLVDLANHPQIVFSYAAMRGETIICALFAWISTYHPFCTYVRLVNGPSTDHGMVGKELMTLALEDHDIQFPLQTSIWETSTDLKAFYESYGFVEVRKTILPVLDVTDLHVRVPKEPSYSIKTIEECVGNEIMMNQLTRLVKEHYEQTHLDNPIVDLPLTTWNKLILSEDLMTNGSFVYVDQEDCVLAYSFLHHSESEYTVELGWCGSRHVNQIELISELTSLQIEYAKQQGIQYVEGEFDTTNPFAMHVYEQFPFPNSPNWLTYQCSKRNIAT